MAETLSVLKTILPQDLAEDNTSSPNTPKRPKYAGLETSLAFQAELVAELVYNRKFGDDKAWKRSIATYMSIWLEDSRSAAFSDDVRSHYQAIDRVGFIGYHLL